MPFQRLAFRTRAPILPAMFRPGQVGLLCLWGAGLAPCAGQGQLLFDAAQGTLPAAQGWSYAAVPGLAVQTHTGTAVRLDTTAANAESAGYARRLEPPLDRRTGFNLVLRVRLPVERHARAERAGFSVIVLDAERRGIELGFWQDQVFAQADQPLFTRAESAAFRFDLAPVELVLHLGAAQYTLFANRAPLLSGPVRDYTAFTGFPDVYETPNFVFLGDNTTSAAAELELFEVALVRPPQLTWPRPGPLTWQGVPRQTYTVEFSPDARAWTPAARVFSDTELFQYEPAAGLAAGFYRLVHP